MILLLIDCVVYTMHTIIYKINKVADLLFESKEILPSFQ
jgi:hypothetical protein